MPDSSPHRRPRTGSRTRAAPLVTAPVADPIARLLGRLPPEQAARLRERWGFYAWTPGAFVREVIQVSRVGTCATCRNGTCHIDPWQDEVMHVQSRHRQQSVIGGSGVGKETVAAWLMLWFGVTRPFSKVAAASASQAQLTNALWQELKKWIDHSDILSVLLHWTERRIVVRGYEDRWRMWQQVAATRAGGEADPQAEGAAGIHGPHVFMVLSEASGLDDAQWDARVATLSERDNRILALANPVRNEGRLYETWMKPARRAEVLGGPGWWLRRVTRLESSFVDPAATEDLIRTYGVDHPVVRAKVYAEFPETSTVGTAIPPAVVDRMFLRHEAPDAPGEELQVGVDVAREGGDETACYVRRGCRILGAIHKTHTPGPEVVQMAVQLAFRWWRRPWNDPRTDAWYPETPEDWEKLRDTILFVVDETGVGGPILDSIRALGLRGVGVNNGGSARRKDRFANIGAEMWLDDALRWMDTGYCAEDERLRAQLTQRKVQYSGVGEQRRLESKEKMRPRRGSPDRADGFVLSVARVRAPGLADFSRAAIGL